MQAASNVLGSVGVTVSAIAVAVFVLFIIIETLQGLRRGWKKQTLHALCTLESAVFSFIVVKAITTAVINAIDADSIGEMIESSGMSMNADVAKYISGARWLIALPVSTLIAPAAFVMFFVLAIVFARIMYFVTKKLLSLPKKPESMKERLIGIPIGAIEGMILCSILLLPLAGTVSIVDDGVNAIREKDEGAYTEFIEEYDRTIAPLSRNVAFRTARALGGDAVLSALATFEDGGERINLRDEIVPAVSIAVELGTLDGFDMKNIQPAEQEILNSVVDTLDESEYLSILISDTLSGMASAVGDGVIPFSAEPPFDKLMSDVIALFETSNKDNLADDLRSVLAIYYMLSDDGVLAAIDSGDSEALRDMLITRDASGQTLVNKIVTTLKDNPHTEPLVSTLTELSVALISDQLGLDGETAEVYDSVKEGLRDTLTIKPSDYPDTEEGYAQYKQDLADSVSSTFAENGIELEPEVVDGIADYIEENFEEKDEYTDEEINEIILSYYDAYIDYLESGELPDNLPDDLPDNLPDDLPGIEIPDDGRGDRVGK